MKSTTAIAALAAVAALAISAPARADIFSITIDGSRLNEQGTELPFEAIYVFDSGICRREFAGLASHARLIRVTDETLRYRTFCLARHRFAGEGRQHHLQHQRSYPHFHRDRDNHH
jgi:hypothetical protein